MSDTITNVPASPKPARKAKAKRAKPVSAKKPIPVSELDGLTANDCPFDCGPSGCVITGDICGHPNKGGLQSGHQGKPAVIRKFAEARRILAHSKVDKRA